MQERNIGKVKNEVLKKPKTAEEQTASWRMPASQERKQGAPPGIGLPPEFEKKFVISTKTSDQKWLEMSIHEKKPILSN